MSSLDDRFDKLMADSASPARRLRPKAAAQYLGVHPRTLEESRRCWRRAEKEGKPELRRGPKFYKVGKRVLYEVRDLDEVKGTGRRRGQWPLDGGRRRVYGPPSAHARRLAALVATG